MPASAVIQGVELNVADVKFDFLPGFLSDFGGSANVSFITFDSPDIRMADGSFRKLPQLLYSSKTIENFSLLYSHGPFSGEVAYNFTGKMPISFDTNKQGQRPVVGRHQHRRCAGEISGHRLSVVPRAGQEPVRLAAAESRGPDPAAQLLDAGKRPRLLCRRRGDVLRMKFLIAAAVLATAAAIPADAPRRISFSCSPSTVSTGAICATAISWGFPSPISAIFSRRARWPTASSACGRPSPGPRTPRSSPARVPISTAS